MTKRDGFELGSTIHERLDSIRMTRAEREVAIGSLRTAFIIVDTCVRVANGLRHLVASLGHKPTAAH